MNILFFIQRNLMEVAFKDKWFKTDFYTVYMYERTTSVSLGHPND